MTPVCRKCTALAMPIRTASLSDQVKAFAGLFSANGQALDFEIFNKRFILLVD